MKEKYNVLILSSLRCASFSSNDTATLEFTLRKLEPKTVFLVSVNQYITIVTV